MSWSDLAVFYGCVLASILACRCVPMLALRGRPLSPRVGEALGLIPAAAFSALVANDLFDPAAGVSVPALVSAAAVVLVARRTGSLIWCALAGMASFALLGAI